MARDGIHRLDLAGEAFGGADIQEDSLGGELAGAVRFEHSEVAGRRREGAAAVRGTSVVTFPPPACHAASPPSSTRTSVSPKYRKIHQARAAAMQFPDGDQRAHDAAPPNGSTSGDRVARPRAAPG